MHGYRILWYIMMLSPSVCAIIRFILLCFVLYCIYYAHTYAHKYADVFFCGIEK